MRLVAKRSFFRAAHLYWRVSRGLTLGVRAIALDADDRVCLVRHTYISGWHLPGGGVEAGETALDALARELREEAGILLDPAAPPQLHGIFHNRAVTTRDHVLVYVVRAFARGAVTVPNREIAEVAFFPRTTLPPGTGAPTRRRLDEVADGRPGDPDW